MRAWPGSSKNTSKRPVRGSKVSRAIRSSAPGAMCSVRSSLSKRQRQAAGVGDAGARPASARTMRASMSSGDDRVACACDDDVGEAAGVEPRSFVRRAAPRARARPHGPGLAEIGRAEDRDACDAAPALSTRSPMRTRSAPTVAAGRSVGTVPFAFTGASAVSAPRTAWSRRRRRRCRCEARRASKCDADHGASPQRIMAEVDCSIWSVAEMTLAFIS